MSHSQQIQLSQTPESLNQWCCVIQCGSHLAVCGFQAFSATEKLDFSFNLNLSSHIKVVTTILDSTALENRIITHLV